MNVSSAPEAINTDPLKVKKAGVGLFALPRAPSSELPKEKEDKPDSASTIKLPTTKTIPVQEMAPKPTVTPQVDPGPFNVPGRVQRTLPFRRSGFRRHGGPAVLPQGHGYAKLQDANNARVSFLVRGLNLVLGRKTANLPQVDIHLGNSKQISRLHCLIEYNFTSRNFQCSCLSKNGMKVDGISIGPGALPVAIYSQSLIEIGRRRLWFLLSSSTRKEEEGPLDRAKRLGFKGIVRNPDPEPIATQQFAQPVIPRRAESEAVPKAHATAGARAIRKPILKKLYAVPPQVRPESLHLWPSFLPRDENMVWRNEVVKPPYQYVTLIIQALAKRVGESLTLQEIFAFIEDRYPFYRHSIETAWRSSVRHNLSMLDCFLKIARGQISSEFTKICGWMLSPDVPDTVIKQGCCMYRRTEIKDGVMEPMDTSEASRYMSNSIKKRQEKRLAKVYDEGTCEKEEIEVDDEGSEFDEQLSSKRLKIVQQ